MRHFLFLTVFFILSCKAIAQQQDSTATEQSRWSLGISASAISFHIYYKEGTTPGAVRAGYFEPVSLTLGYSLSERASIHAGLGYGRDKDQVTILLQDGEQKFTSTTHAVAAPVSMRFILFNLHKRLPIYGTASVIPAYGVTNAKAEESIAGELNSYTTRNTGLNVFATAGIGFNYKISSRFFGNATYFFYKTNLTG